MCKRAEVITPDGEEIECDTVRELHEALCGIVYDDDGNEMLDDDSCLCGVDFSKTAIEASYKVRYPGWDERPELIGGVVFYQ